MGNHTPGPWYVTGQDYRAGRVVDSRSYEICVPLVETEAQGFANARLIASAPDLLDALELCVTDLERLNACYGIMESNETIAARAAIAKATGESR